jgi:hypothetical protein
MTGIEPQDELKEELNRVISEPEKTDGESVNPVAEDVIESVTDDNTSDDLKVDTNDPVFKAGQKHMQEAMQKAMDKRIAKEVAKRKAIENQLDPILKRLEAVEKTNVAPKPKLSEYNTEEEYDNALIKWTNKSTPSSVQAMPQITSSEAMAYTQKEVEYTKTHPEYYNDLEDLKPFLTETLRETLFESGPAVTHYLTQNLEVADQIAKLSPAKMGRAIGLIELSLKKELPLPKKAVPKPAPAQDLRGKSSGAKDISLMTQSEYNKYMSSI